MIGDERPLHSAPLVLENLNIPNRRMRTRMSGGLGGESERYPLRLPIPIWGP